MTDQQHRSANSAPMTGAEFRALREWAGLSGEEAAGRLGITERTIRRWELGHQQPPARVREEMWRLVDESEDVADELVAQARENGWTVLIPIDGDARGSATWWRMVAARAMSSDPSLRVEYLITHQPLARSTPGVAGTGQAD